jgi:hypothetical protein
MARTSSQVPIQPRRQAWQVTKERPMNTQPKYSYGIATEDLEKHIVDPSHPDHFKFRHGIRCNGCGRIVNGHVMAANMPKRMRKIQCSCSRIFIVKYNSERWPTEFLVFKNILKMTTVAKSSMPTKGS